MGAYAEGDHKAEEHSRRVARAQVQLRGVHDALHVLISMPFCFVFMNCVYFENFEFDGNDCDIIFLLDVICIEPFIT